ncbi:hypothetical protein HDV05_002963, partial [Chytridiales sp. JEL 0842]
MPGRKETTTNGLPCIIQFPTVVMDPQDASEVNSADEEEDEDGFEWNSNCSDQSSNISDDEGVEQEEEEQEEADDDDEDPESNSDPLLDEASKVTHVRTLLSDQMSAHTSSESALGPYMRIKSPIVPSLFNDGDAVLYFPHENEMGALIVKDIDI